MTIVGMDGCSLQVDSSRLAWTMGLHL